MKIILVAHPDRIEYVKKLQTYLPILTTVVDTISARSGHMTALKLAAEHDERVVIMEDDAIPVSGFNELAEFWCKAHPDDMISFYLGTSRPKEIQPWLDHRIGVARAAGETSILINMLLHGVCYSIPRDRIDDVVRRMTIMSRIHEADFAIGSAWGKRVVYPIESLVQHRDEQPVEKHPNGEARIEPRVARALAGPLMFNP